MFRLRQGLRLPPLRLRTRLMIAFMVVMLIPVLQIGVYGFSFTSQELTEEALARSEREVYLQAEHLVAALRQVHGDAVYLSQMRSLATLRSALALSTDAGLQATWRDEATADFAVLLATRPMYRALRYLDESGMEIIRLTSDAETVHTTQPDQLISLQDRTYFVETQKLRVGGVFVSAFVSSSNSDETVPLLHYSLRLPDGVLVLDLSVSWLLRNLPETLQTDTWALIDQDGIYLVHSNQTTAPTTTVNGRESIGAWLAPVLTSPSGTFQADGEVIVYSRILPSGSTPEKFWVLYRRTPVQVLYASAVDFYEHAGLLTVAGLVAALLLALVTGQSIAAPILDLERQAAAFGRGGKAPKLPDRLSSDEIGALTRTFTEMAQELERKREEARMLIDRLITAQEEERKLLAYDLHDGLIQQLVGARFYLTNCLNHAAADGEGSDYVIQNPEGLRQGHNALSEAIVEGRRIIEGLRPATLDDLGLSEAMNELAHTTAQAAGWKLNTGINPPAVEPDKTTGVTLYRIAQEALNNIRKHADAREVEIQMHNGNGIHLMIRDDGKGFDPDTMIGSTRNFGISTMRERAELLGGRCEIASVPGRGTVVTAWVPQQRAATSDTPATPVVSRQHRWENE